MEQQANIFLLARGTWHSECDLLLHIFALLEYARDWAACAMVCRMWNRLIPMARPFSLRGWESKNGQTAWLEKHSPMLSKLHTCSFGDMKGSIMSRRRFMRLVFNNAPALRRVFFKNETEWHTDDDLPIFDSLSPSIRTIYGGVLHPIDWKVMHPKLQLTCCWTPAELLPCALVHLRDAMFIKCNLMDRITIGMLPAYNEALLTLEIFLVPKYTCMLLTQLPKLQHLRIGQGIEDVIDLNSFPALLSFAFRGSFQQCTSSAAEDFCCEVSCIRWVRKGYAVSNFQKISLFAYSGKTYLSKQMEGTLTAADHMHDFDHPMDACLI